MHADLIGIMILPVALAGVAFLKFELDKGEHASECRIRAGGVIVAAVVIVQSILAAYLGTPSWIVGAMVLLLSLACFILLLACLTLDFETLRKFLVSESHIDR